MNELCQGDTPWRPTGATDHQIEMAAGQAWDDLRLALDASHITSWGNLDVEIVCAELAEAHHWASYLVPEGYAIVPVKTFENLQASDERNDSLIAALTSVDIYPIIEYMLNEGLVTQEYVQANMDQPLEIWRSSLVDVINGREEKKSNPLILSYTLQISDRSRESEFSGGYNG